VRLAAVQVDDSGMENSRHTVRRVVLDGPRVTVEHTAESGMEASTHVFTDCDDARSAAAITAATYGTYVHDTAHQDALAFLP
jgi:hypothetical protein